jgi:hypothetical protein
MRSYLRLRYAYVIRLMHFAKALARRVIRTRTVKDPGRKRPRDI